MHEQDFIDILVELAKAYEGMQPFWREDLEPQSLAFGVRRERMKKRAPFEERWVKALHNAIDTGRKFTIPNPPSENTSV